MEHTTSLLTLWRNFPCSKLIFIIHVNCIYIHLQFFLSFFPSYFNFILFSCFFLFVSSSFQSFILYILSYVHMYIFMFFKHIFLSMWVYVYVITVLEFVSVCYKWRWVNCILTISNWNHILQKRIIISNNDKAERDKLSAYLC